MSRVLCKECKNNNHGWCNVRKTNKLKDLITCEYKDSIAYEYKEIEKLDTLKEYYDQKKWQYENILNERTNENRCILKGLEIAINILSK